LTGHPIEQYETEINQFVKTSIAQLKAGKESQIIAGLVMAMRIMRNKRGDKMAFVTLDDRTGRLEVSIFADVFVACQDILTKDALWVVEGEVSVDDYSGQLKMIARKVVDINQARQTYVKEVVLRLEGSTLTEHFPFELAEILKPHVGDQCPVIIEYQGREALARLRLGAHWKVKPNDALIKHLQERLGRKHVSLNYG
jgi:DNA polymerase-3 subunit alpha